LIDHGKKNVLGILVDSVDYASALDRILQAARQQRPLLVSATAVHGLMTAVLDAQQRYRLNQFDLVVPDGQPLVWALNALYATALPDRVYGPRLTLELCQQAASQGLPVYFYGSKAEVLNRLTARLQNRFPDLMVAGSSPSLFRTTTPQEKREIAARIRDSGARLVFVGLGCPRQEVWAYEYRELLPCPLVAVGAAFDFHAGSLAQAPQFLQDHGLEWLFRLVHEPRRLWKRYLGLNPLFCALLALQWLAGARVFPPHGKPPSVELGYG
jgi:exopolysaccharide biosynthesis WecB/TagA/CpsF family protein